MSRYPNAVRAVLELIDGETFADRLVTGYVRLPVEFGDHARTGAAVLVYGTGGREGWIDRVDNVTVEVYAPPLIAEDVAEAIRSDLCGDLASEGRDGRPHDTEEGYLDGIRCEVTPHDVPYPSDVIAQARMSLHVTSRPLPVG